MKTPWLGRTAGVAASMRWMPLVGLAGAAAYFAQRSFWLDQPAMFYPAVVVMAVAVEFFIGMTRLGRLSIVSTIGHTLMCFALLLPVADLIYVKSQRVVSAASPPKPVYSYRDNEGNPDGFHAWWAYYAGQWALTGGNVKVEMPDPQGQLPFVLVPNGRVKMFFGSDYSVDSLGFFDREFSRAKNIRYRIFVIGES